MANANAGPKIIVASNCSWSRPGVHAGSLNLIVDVVTSSHKLTRCRILFHPEQEKCLEDQNDTSVGFLGLKIYSQNKLNKLGHGHFANPGHQEIQ